MTNNKPQKGFTLIELLVVVAIISLLSSVVLGALNDARAKARDRALVQQAKQIQIALELYKDKYGFYPAITPYSRINSSGTWSGSATTIESTISEFIPKITPPSTGYIYYYNRTEATCAGHTSTAPYVIFVKPETSFMSDFPEALYNNVPGGIFTGYKCFSVF